MKTTLKLFIEQSPCLLGLRQCFQTPLRRTRACSMAFAAPTAIKTCPTLGSTDNPDWIKVVASASILTLGCSASFWVIRIVFLGLHIYTKGCTQWACTRSMSYKKHTYKKQFFKDKETILNLNRKNKKHHFVLNQWEKFC